MKIELLEKPCVLSQRGEEMKKYYVSGKYDGIDIGMEVEAPNQYMAVYTFIDEISTTICSEMSEIFVSAVEEVEL